MKRRIIAGVLASFKVGCTSIIGAYAKSAVPVVGEDTKAQLNAAIEGSLESKKGVLDKGFVFEGYDIDTANEVYGLDFEEFIEGGDLNAALDSDKPFYIVSFDNGKNTGEIYLSPDENGGFSVTDSFIYDDSRSKDSAKFNFDRTELDEKLQQSREVSDVRLYQDGTAGVNLAAFKSFGEEYVIPYFTLGDSELTSKNGTVYTKDEFISLMGEGFKEQSADAAGGSPVSAGNTQPSVEQVKNTDAENDESGLQTIIVCAGMICAAALTAFILLRKKS